MKMIRAYLNEKGQDLVEYTLILAFCAVMLLGLNSDEAHNTIRQVFEKGVFDDVKTVIAAGNPYTMAVVNWSESSRRTLAVVEKDPTTGKWVLKRDANGNVIDVIPNADRLEADRQALYNIADFFMNMDEKTLKQVVFDKELGNDWFNQNTDKGKKGILILSYTDRAEVEGNYDPVTQQYTNGNTTKVDITTEGRHFQANEVIHWMQGDYGNYKDSNGQYDSSKDFNSTQRYFYSNEMIDPDGSGHSNSVKRNVRVNFTITDGKVTGVTVRAQQNGDDVAGLKVQRGDG